MGIIFSKCKKLKNEVFIEQKKKTNKSFGYDALESKDSVISTEDYSNNSIMSIFKDHNDNNNILKIWKKRMANI